ncbi:MAG: M48 family metallopeptidase [Candidatus Susulua stagnicola]|nr:M48 family metallopeptidase [Candidatus Susulua stagnicola]
MNIYLIIILTIIIGNYILDLIIELFNLRSIKKELPEEFVGFYDANKYEKSQEYLKDNTKFKLIQGLFTVGVILFLILSGGFNFVDQLARSFNLNLIFTGLIFTGILFFFFQIIEIPFSIYHTFVIEEKYGFNRTKPKTFFLDLIKGWVLSIIIGGLLFSLVLWFFITSGELAWIFCWLGVSIFELFLIFIAPIVIMPLFNKFIPLEDGELKQTIETYAKSQNFKLKGLFKMDGSRRSSKSNAFFTGFGRYRRIVLFDTLIKNHSIKELVSILAHEMGHYKKKHILKTIIISILANGLMFFILSLFINNQGLFDAFRMDNLSIYASLLFFTFLYAPINIILSLAGNILSRKHEYEADNYAITTYKNPQAFILALKKLSVDNLSNLTPHPLKVFMAYSHPPVLERIKALRGHNR